MTGSKYTDTTAALQVIGCIYKQPSLLNDEGRYFFSEEDFTNDFHKIIFGAMYNLHTMGTKSFSPKIIEDYLQGHPESLALYKTSNGATWIKEQELHAELSGFDYYYSRLKKFTLLREYERYGLNLKWIYDPNEIFDAKKKQKQEEYFDSLSLEKIADLIDEGIESIRRTYVDNSLEESQVIGTNILELIEELQQTPEAGPPMYGALINTVTRGMRNGKLYLRSAASGVGKALPNSTIIPTPLGERTVGTIKKGDYVFDAFGKPTKVLEIYPQGKKEVYEVVFKDGRVAFCNNEHLWSYCKAKQRKESKEKRKFYTKTLQQIIDEEKLFTKDGCCNILVPNHYAVEYKEKIYPIPPYVMGAMLGDGSFRQQISNKAIQFSSDTKEIPEYIAQTMNYTLKKGSDKNFSWYFSFKEKEQKHENVWVEDFLQPYPELINIYSHEKFIPREYFYGSIEQRFDLLNGLLDTDGSVDDKGRVSYITNSPLLREDVKEIARSLGFSVHVIEDNHKKTSTCWIINLKGRPEDKVKLFKLKRKHEIILNWFNNGKRKESNDFTPIVQINKLNKKEEMTCFYVDNDEHLFLMNDYIVTHNTRTMIADACNCACDKIYDVISQSWIDNGKKFPSLYIATEQELDEIQTMALAFLACVDEEHILTGQYSFGEKERVIEAAKVLQESPLFIEYIPDFTLRDIENCIKRHIRMYEVQYVFYDYIHTSMRMLEEITKRSGGVRLREDNLLFLLSVKLKDICTQFNVFILTSTQLNAGWKTDDIPDQNLLRGAKSIADKSDFGSILLDVTEKDKEGLQTLLEEKGFPEPNVKLSVYKNRRGSYNKCYLWMVADKSTCRFNGVFCTSYNYKEILIGESNVVVNLD